MIVFGANTFCLSWGAHTLENGLVQKVAAGMCNPVFRGMHGLVATHFN